MAKSGRVRVKSAAGNIGRIIVTRLLSGTDLIEGIEDTCNCYNIKAAVVTCAIGSLKKNSFRYIVPKSELKVGAGYDEPPHIPGPVELIGASGIVTEIDENTINVHLHGAICDKNGIIHGGHFDKGENLALYTIEVVIKEIVNVKMLRKYDEEVDTNQLFPVALNTTETAE